MLLFDWDEANTDHIALHGVTPSEVEQVLRGATLELDAYFVGDELRTDEVGTTQSGRVLKVVSTARSGKIRVVTAYDPSRSLKLAFLRYQSESHD